MNGTLDIYNRVSRLPLGKRIFSRLLCMRAPYFGTIRPRFVALRPGYGEISMKNRRRIRNHLGSVHAVAMCNLCELLGGLTLDVSLPGNLRWIPGGMEVEYLKIAKTDLTGTCVIAGIETVEPGELPVRVSIRDTNGIEVFRGTIRMHITAKKRAA